jgi:hypothetical protein
VVAILATVAAAAPLARADDAPLPPTSAISQYVEQLPSSTGSVGLGGSGGSAATKPKPKPLPPKVSKAIARDGGDDATVLEQVATNPDYGAPAAAPKAAKRSGATGTTSTRTTPSKGGSQAPSRGSDRAEAAQAPHAVDAAVSTAGSSGLWPLAIVIVAVTAAAIVLKARRQ